MKITTNGTYLLNANWYGGPGVYAIQGVNASASLSLQFQLSTVSPADDFWTAFSADTTNVTTNLLKALMDLPKNTRLRVVVTGATGSTNLEVSAEASKDPSK